MKQTTMGGAPRKDFAHYFYGGINSARRGDCRSPATGEYLMPVFGEGKSWQAKAFAAGYRDQCKAMGKTVRAEGFRETYAPQSEGD